MPKDKVLVFDVEAAILAVKITGNDFQKVLNEVEQGKYKDEKFLLIGLGGSYIIRR